MAADRDADAIVSWRQGDGRHRHIGEPPVGSELLAPTLEDGYLTLLDHHPAAVAS
jgi:ABC-2 type transport system ATP-binding protein